MTDTATLNGTYYTTGEVAGILGKSRRLVYDLFDNGELSGVTRPCRKGLLRFVTRDSLWEYMDKHGIVPDLSRPSSVQMRASEFYTTGQVAQLMRCSPRTVAKWCDSGVLIALRMPGSLDRRIRHDDLLAFMRANGYAKEADRLGGQRDVILCWGASERLLASLESQRWACLVETSLIDAALRWRDLLAGVVLLDAVSGITEVRQFASWLLRQSHPPTVIVLMPEDGGEPPAGCSVLQHPVSEERLTRILDLLRKRP